MKNIFKKSFLQKSIIPMLFILMFSTVSKKANAIAICNLDNIDFSGIEVDTKGNARWDPQWKLSWKNAFMPTFGSYDQGLGLDTSKRVIDQCWANIQAACPKITWRNHIYNRDDIRLASEKEHWKKNPDNKTVDEYISVPVEIKTDKIKEPNAQKAYLIGQNGNQNKFISGWSFSNNPKRFKFNKLVNKDEDSNKNQGDGAIDDIVRMACSTGDNTSISECSCSEIKDALTVRSYSSIASFNAAFVSFKNRNNCNAEIDSFQSKLVGNLYNVILSTPSNCNFSITINPATPIQPIPPTEIEELTELLKELKPLPKAPYYSCSINENANQVYLKLRSFLKEYEKFVTLTEDLDIAAVSNGSDNNLYASFMSDIDEEMEYCSGIGDEVVKVKAAMKKINTKKEAFCSNADEKQKESFLDELDPGLSDDDFLDDDLLFEDTVRASFSGGDSAYNAGLNRRLRSGIGRNASVLGAETIKAIYVADQAYNKLYDCFKLTYKRAEKIAKRASGYEDDNPAAELNYSGSTSGPINHNGILNQISKIGHKDDFKDVCSSIKDLYYYIGGESSRPSSCSICDSNSSKTADKNTKDKLVSCLEAVQWKYEQNEQDKQMEYQIQQQVYPDSWSQIKKKGSLGGGPLTIPRIYFPT